MSCDSEPVGQCLTCCAGCQLYLPLLFVVPFLRKDYVDHHCNNCGHEWPAQTNSSNIRTRGQEGCCLQANSISRYSAYGRQPHAQGFHAY